jgi:CBS domain-containing protein/ribosome-associated translation inhibitor RaiA
MSERNSLYESWELSDYQDRVSSSLGDFIARGRSEVYYTLGKRLGVVRSLDILKVHTPETARLSNLGIAVSEVPAREVSFYAKAMLEREMKSYPVRRENGSVKVITAWAAVSLISNTLMKYRVKDVMTPNPVVVTGNDRASKVRKEMITNKVEHILVKGDGGYGVITAKRMIMEIYTQRSPATGEYLGRSAPKFEFPASRLVQNIESVQPDVKLSEVLPHLKREPYALAVEVWGELQGILTVSDLLKTIITKSKNIPPYYIIGLPTEPFEYEAARTKVERFSIYASKLLRGLEEVKCVIKKKSKEKKRYEVELQVKAKGGGYNFSEEGYDIAEIFDRLVSKAKKRLSEYAQTKRPAKRSIRKVLEQ